jgi:hypothetical protein
MNTRTTWQVAALALLLGVSGCSGSGLVKASGKLTYKGQPVPSTLVTFQPEDGSRRSTGVTDDEGNFTLRFSRTQEGVKRGTHVVSLKYEVSTDEELHKIKPKASKELKKVIAQYGDPKKAPRDLRYEVTESGQFFAIDLQ